MHYLIKCTMTRDTLHKYRGATLARLGIGSVAGNREILGPLAKQLEDRHLSPMHNTPPERQMQPKRRMPREHDDDGEALTALFSQFSLLSF